MCSYFNLKIPSTPNSELLNLIKDRVEHLKLPKEFKVLLREDNGEKINKSFLNSINPWPEKECLRPDCLICQSGGKKGGCWKTGVTYQITCLPCQQAGVLARYCGESGRTGYSRGLEHQDNLQRGKRGQPLSDHCIEYHNGEKQDFEMEVTGGFKRPLPRLVAEGQNIDMMLNQKIQNPGKVIILLSPGTEDQSNCT